MPDQKQPEFSLFTQEDQIAVDMVNEQSQRLPVEALLENIGVTDKSIFPEYGLFALNSTLGKVSSSPEFQLAYLEFSTSFSRLFKGEFAPNIVKVANSLETHPERQSREYLLLLEKVVEAAAACGFPSLLKLFFGESVQLAGTVKVDTLHPKYLLVMLGYLSDVIVQSAPVKQEAKERYTRKWDQQIAAEQQTIKNLVHDDQAEMEKSKLRIERLQRLRDQIERALYGEFALIVKGKIKELKELEYDYKENKEERDTLLYSRRTEPVVIVPDVTVYQPIQEYFQRRFNWPENNGRDSLFQRVAETQDWFPQRSDSTADDAESTAQRDADELEKLLKFPQGSVSKIFSQN